MNGSRLTKFLMAITLVLGVLVSTPVWSRPQVRDEIDIPDIPGYLTLKCDFHIHTVFSDGTVWPTVRVQEAWAEGLDAISITDHIEYQPHKKDIPTNHNRPYELALSTANSLGIILIKGAEITRSMPPGHLNAIFLNDVEPLDTKEWRDVLRAAREQDAFVFWNHPPFPQPEGKSVWYPEHQEIFDNGWMQGIEVVNGGSYYRDSHIWCLKRNLTMIGTSDIHTPTIFVYDFDAGEHRPITLVFAEERTEEALKSALFAGRTAVYWKNQLIGKAEYLQPIFRRSIQIKEPEIRIKGKGRAVFHIHNSSEVTYELVADGTSKEVSAPGKITLYAGKTVPVTIRGKSEELHGKRKVRIPYKVTNMLVAPDTGLPVKIRINCDFGPKPEAE